MAAIEIKNLQAVDKPGRNHFVPVQTNDGQPAGKVNTYQLSRRGYRQTTGNYMVTLAQRDILFDCTTTLTLSLPGAADAGEGFLLSVKANGGTVTIDPNGSENIDGSLTLVLANGQSAEISCDGTGWYSSYITAAITAAASETVAGVAEIATTAEAQAGTDDLRFITPKKLQDVSATTSRSGVVELATNAEAQAQTDSVRAVTPANLGALGATLTMQGLVELATTAEVKTATDTARVASLAAMRYHPAAPKMWTHINYTGGTPFLVSNYNVSSIVDTAQGRVQINLSMSFSSTNWACLANAGTPNEALIACPDTRSFNSVIIQIRDLNSNMVDPPLGVSVIGLGDQ